MYLFIYIYYIEVFTIPSKNYTWHVIPWHINIDLFIYIYIETERYIYIYVYIYVCVCVSIIVYIPAGPAPAALASLLFAPPEPQIIGKTQYVATFLPFRTPGSSFFSDFLFFTLLSSCLLLSDSSHLCFSFIHIVGSLTSKFPSVK
jgi:hypothetical protein